MTSLSYVIKSILIKWELWSALNYFFKCKLAQSKLAISLLNEKYLIPHENNYLLNCAVRSSSEFKRKNSQTPKGYKNNQGEI